MPDHDAPTFVPEHPLGSDEPTQSQSAAAQPGGGSSRADDASPLPASIGRYRILRLLGEGGMGAVYEAQQDFPHRTVALKVIRAGYASSEMLRRFENEAQALGRLQHPGIAQMYEAGTAETPFGRQPCFAMELVQGQSLVACCDAHRLNARQRLELMAKICDAVQHAHQRGLIHRDLKPANILVDESGQPKILDFGVARLTDSDAEATRQTDIGQLVGTLAYMSPEQVLGDPAEIDTRSDVYALGVILYELLAGKGPYSLGHQLPDAVRAIREEEPTALGSMNRTYRGDVETIAGKALEKDKTRRYSSAAELGADIRRHLRDEPITARPPSTTYQLQKFARRNKALMTGVAAVFVVLVAGIVASTWEAVKARRAEANAKKQSAIAQAVNDFLQNDLLGQASAYNQSKPDPDIKVRVVLDRAAQNIQGEFDRQPEVEAAIRDTIGQTYIDLGLYPETRTQLERALDLQRRALGANNPQTLKTMSRLGRLAYVQGKYPEAESLVSQALAIQRRVLGSDHPDTLYSMNNLANVYYAQGKDAQAETLYDQTLQVRRRILGPEHRDTLSTMVNLASAIVHQRRYAQAEVLSRQALEMERRVLGAEHPETLRCMNNLADAYRGQGEYAQAETLYNQTLQVRRRLLGPDHPETLFSMGSLATVYEEEGKYAQAEKLDSQTLEIERRVLGPEHQKTLWTIQDLGKTYIVQGKYAQGEALYRKTLEAQRRVLGPEHPDTLFTIGNLANSYLAEGRYAEAEALFKQVLEAWRRVVGEQRPETLWAIGQLAYTYGAEGKYAQEETLYREDVKANPDSRYRLNRLARLLVSVPGRSRRRPEEALQLARRALKGTPDVATYYNTLGLAEYRNGLWDEAVVSLNKSAEMNKGSDPTDFLFLAMAHWRRGDKGEAEQFYQRGVKGSSKGATDNWEWRMFWAEAAELLGKPGPKAGIARSPR